MFNPVPALPQLTRDKERVGEYATRERALRYAELNRVSTGVPHIAIKASVTRNDGREFQCWTAVAVPFLEDV